MVLPSPGILLCPSLAGKPQRASDPNLSLLHVSEREHPERS
jgi:hypothetical protein